MVYSRRSLILGAATILGLTPVAFAQQNDPQTLNAQMDHAAPSPIPPGAYRPWSGTAAPAAAPETFVAPQGADGEMIDSEGSGAIPSLPLEVQTNNGITYVTGGVGDEEVAQLKSSVHNYNLHLLMSAPGGAFIGDVTVNIADAGGANVLMVQNAGPYFYAKLLPGKYTVELNEDGQARKLAMTIKDGSHVDKTVQFNESGGVITPHQPTATVD